MKTKGKVYILKTFRILKGLEKVGSKKWLGGKSKLFRGAVQPKIRGSSFFPNCLILILNDLDGK